MPILGAKGRRLTHNTWMENGKGVGMKVKFFYPKKIRVLSQEK